MDNLRFDDANLYANNTFSQPISGQGESLDPVSFQQVELLKKIAEESIKPVEAEVCATELINLFKKETTQESLENSQIETRFDRLAELFEQKLNLPSCAVGLKKASRTAKAYASNIYERLGQSIPDKSGFYIGGNLSRGLVEYGVGFLSLERGENLFWSELLKIGSNGKILDAGCGFGYLARDLYSGRLNPEERLSLGGRFRYWAGKAPETLKKYELSEYYYESSKLFYDLFGGIVDKLRLNPPNYVGVTTEGLSKKTIDIDLDVFTSNRVTIHSGRYFSEIPNQELASGDSHFDMIVDCYGVFSYSRTLELDTQKMLSLLKVGGRLFIRREHEYRLISYPLQNGLMRKEIRTKKTLIFNDKREISNFACWFSAGNGVKVVEYCEHSDYLTIVLEKTEKDVTLPRLKYEEDIVDPNGYSCPNGYIFSA